MVLVLVVIVLVMSDLFYFSSLVIFLLNLLFWRTYRLGIGAIERSLVEERQSGASLKCGRTHT
jgi:hypothetical protein